MPRAPPPARGIVMFGPGLEVATMPRPITDTERERVRRLHSQGKSRNEIARELGRSGSTVSGIARDLGLDFTRGAEVVAATEARRIDLAARRAELAEALHVDAERLRAQLWEPCTYGEFAGRDGEWHEVQLARPRFADQRQILAATGTAIDRSLKLAPVEGGEGADQVRSMLGALGEALTMAAGDTDDDGGADGGEPVLDLDRLPLSRKQLLSVGRATARINIWHGSVRSGKTVASLLAFVIAVAAAGPSGLIIICGRSLQTIERNVFEPLADPALFGPLSKHVHHTRGATTATILGRTVHLIGAADTRAEGRLRGLTAQLAYVDEATLVPEGFWTQLLARLSTPGARLLATTNPDSPRHWLKVGYLDRAHELDLRAWHFKLRDNPSLSPAYVAALSAEYVGLWRRRMIDGAWVVAEGAVYDMWDESRHVVTELPPMRRLLGVGIDYGTTNPFAAILLGLGADGRLYAVSEWRHDSRAAHRQMTDAQYSQAVRAWLDGLGAEPEWTFVDPRPRASIANSGKTDTRESPRRRTKSSTASGRCRRRSPPACCSYTTPAPDCSPSCPATAGTRPPPPRAKTARSRPTITASMRCGMRSTPPPTSGGTCSPPTTTRR